MECNMTVEEKKAYNRKYYLKNKEKLKRKQNQYRLENLDKIKVYREENRDSINEYQKLYRKGNKKHLESLFTEGMSWDNHGEWHIDHIVAVSKFDEDTPASIVNALSNLQPLWAKDNLIKSNK